MSEGTPEPPWVESPQALTTQNAPFGHPATFGPSENAVAVVPFLSLTLGPNHLRQTPCAITTFGHVPFPPPLFHGVEYGGPGPTEHATQSLWSVLGTDPTGQLSGVTELAVPLAVAVEKSMLAARMEKSSMIIHDLEPARAL